jgi:hypothetical protein
MGQLSAIYSISVYLALLTTFILCCTIGALDAISGFHIVVAFLEQD